MSGYTNVDGICKIFGIVIDHLLQRTDAIRPERKRGPRRTRDRESYVTEYVYYTPRSNLNSRDLDGRPTACGRAGRLWT